MLLFILGTWKSIFLNFLKFDELRDVERLRVEKENRRLRNDLWFWSRFGFGFGLTPSE